MVPRPKTWGEMMGMGGRRAGLPYPREIISLLYRQRFQPCQARRGYKRGDTTECRKHYPVGCSPSNSPPLRLHRLPSRVREMSRFIIYSYSLREILSTIPETSLSLLGSLIKFINLPQNVLQPEKHSLV